MLLDWMKLRPWWEAWAGPSRSWAYNKNMSLLTQKSYHILLVSKLCFPRK